PSGQKIAEINEPVVDSMVLLPTDYVGSMMELCQQRRGTLKGMEYLSADRVELKYLLPLAEIIFDFFDQLKSRTRGYASLDYEPWDYEESKLARVDILLQAEPVDAFSSVVHRDKAYQYGRAMVERLRELNPRQLFEVSIQAAIVAPGWAGAAFASIFLGGGTPTMLDPAVLEGLLGGLRARFDVEPGAEVTVEANPDTVDAGALSRLLEAGVTRLSLGVQSFD